VKWFVLLLLAPAPQPQRGPLEMGAAALDKGDSAAAVAHLRTAPRNAPALKLLVKAYILNGQKREAEPVAEEVTRLAPADAEGWSLLGRLHQDAGRFREAIAPLEHSLELESGDAVTLVSLANARIGLGEHPRAAAIFEQALAANARRAKPLAAPHASYAIFLLRLDRPAEAEIQARRALAIDPREPLALEAERGVQARLRTAAHAASGAAALPAPRFEDIAERAGIRFRLENSPTPAKHQIETMPGGVAVLDYDNDGFLDIYFTNGAESPSLARTGPRFWNRLYRNNGNLTFTDVTERAGVQGAGYMMGAAAGDFDNDGFPDLFVAGVGRNILYRNHRDGTFRDATASAGLDRAHPEHGRMWGIHAAWLDYDHDGRLDLLVVNYCAWDPKTEPFCGDPRPGYRSYCHPNRYRALPNQLFRNNPDGTFSDVSDVSGIGRHLGKGMGAAIADYDGDGRIDIFVANDTEPNFLFRNLGSGRFAEVGLQAGVAYNQFGKALSSMGADFRDLDNDGLPDLFVTTLSNEGFLLFRNAGGRFDDIADRARLTLPSLPFSGWSNVIADFNNDGWKDLFSANGHALDNVELTESRSYRQPNTLYLQTAPGAFGDVSALAGDDFRRRAAHRGAAAADFDNDGKLDLVVTALGDRAELFHNVTPEAGRWLLVRLVGRASNRDGAGAKLKVQTGDGRTLWNQASASVGFASSGDPRVHFGLGPGRSVRSLEIEWPSGQRQRLENLDADRILTVEEPARAAGVLERDTAGLRGLH